MMSSPNPKPPLAAAFDWLQPYLLAGRVTASSGAIPGGQVLEIQILDPTLTFLAPPGLQLLHQSTGAQDPSVYADPASGLAPF
jgi:hypothetical protein